MSPEREQGAGKDAFSADSPEQGRVLQAAMSGVARPVLKGTEKTGRGWCGAFFLATSFFVSCLFPQRYPPILLITFDLPFTPLAASTD